VLLVLDVMMGSEATGLQLLLLLQRMTGEANYSVHTGVVSTPELGISFYGME